MIVKVQKIASKEIYVHIKNVTKNLTSHSIKYIFLSHIFREYSLKELNYIWKRITKFKFIKFYFLLKVSCNPLIMSFQQRRQERFKFQRY